MPDHSKGATVMILDYDPAWPVRAERLLQIVRSALRDSDNSDMFVYEHIGSTAVPGLAAKPIVDLQVCMPALLPLDALAVLLAHTGFVPAPGARSDSPGVYRDIPRPGDEDHAEAHGKRLFHSPEQSAILHIRRLDSPFAAFVVLVRDWLRAHPDEARRYAELKYELAVQHAADPDYDDYTRSKSLFFDEVEPRMRQWATGKLTSSRTVNVAAQCRT
ncbi:GrpB family protein [Nocardia vinacea]|uniref:GrpB family protein n=1 Tax=Nocardia vinacea TaxID=96468 RepID=UPI002E16345D|nr:GrpB family protein [Nocardia vinacea]